jgi:hypothetical protein
MAATKKGLGFALLFAAGVIIFNVYMVLTGAAGDLYDHLPGTASQSESQAIYNGRISSRVQVFPDGTPIFSFDVLPGHIVERG